MKTCVCYVCEIAPCDQYSNLYKLPADLLNSPNSFSSSHSFENIARELRCCPRHPFIIPVLDIELKMAPITTSPLDP